MRQAAEILKEESSIIVEAWEKKVKKEIPASRISSDLALRNQLPHLIEDISDILKRYEGIAEIYQDEKFEEIIKNSSDHGRHRATSSHYTIKQILREYIVFHQTLTDFFREKELYSKELGMVLKYSLETAMINSASSFTASLQEMREKLVGTLAHDIRTPISTAYFALDMIGTAPDKERFTNLQEMGKKSLKKSLDLLEGLLDAISVRAGEGITLNFKETDIVKEVKWVYNEASEIFSNKIFFKCDSDEISGIFDGTAIRRVVENLVTNAIKYGARKEPITIQLKDSEDQVSIKVHNYGEPIPRESQEDIFRFLNRNHSDQTINLRSWGMGLTLVKSVAQAHGGKVELESNKKEGTSFYIFLGKNSNEPGKVRTELNYFENEDQPEV